MKGQYSIALLTKTRACYGRRVEKKGRSREVVLANVVNGSFARAILPWLSVLTTISPCSETLRL